MFAVISLQLREHPIEGECWLSIDLRVALWMDYRCFVNKPHIKTVGDFVLVTNNLHIDFNNFVAKHIMPDMYLVLAAALLRYWCRCGQQYQTPIYKYGKQYIYLSSSQLDDLCAWIRDMKEQFYKHGRQIFYGLQLLY